jgi:hypothetical protein
LLWLLLHCHCYYYCRVLSMSFHRGLFLSIVLSCRCHVIVVLSCFSIGLVCRRLFPCSLFLSLSLHCLVLPLSFHGLFLSLFFHCLVLPSSFHLVVFCCLVLRCVVLSCLVLPCLALPCLVLSCLALPCLLSCLVF